MSGHFSNEQFSAYFDGEVTPEERADIERLIQTSVDARREFEEYQHLAALLKNLPTQVPPQDLSAHVMQEVTSGLPETTVSSSAAVFSSVAKSSRRGWWIVAGSLTATAAALLVMVNLFGPGEDRLQPQELADSPFANRSVAEPDFRSKARSQADEESPLVAESKTNRKALVESDKAASLMRKREKNTAPVDQNKDATVSKSAAVAAAIPPVDAPKPIGTSSGSTANLAKNSNAPVSPQKGVKSSGLTFKNLKELEDAEIGKMVTALEKTNEGINVIKLTVVDRQKGLKSLQILLARNNIPLDDEKGVKSKGKASSNKNRIQQKSERLVAVYVETTPRQLSAALRELRQAEQFQRLHVRGPINSDQLNRYSGRQFASGSFSGGAKTTHDDFTSGGKKGGSPSIGGSIRIQIGPRASSGKSDVPVAATKPNGETNSSSVKELQKISRQLELSLSPDVLTEMAQTTGRAAAGSANGVTIRLNGRNYQQGSQTKTSSKAPRPEPVKILFILVVNDSEEPETSAPSKPGKSSGKSKSTKKSSDGGAA